MSTNLPIYSYLYFQVFYFNLLFESLIDLMKTIIALWTYSIIVHEYMRTTWGQKAGSAFIQTVAVLGGAHTGAKTPPITTLPTLQGDGLAGRANPSGDLFWLHL
jgi:hypothetical protein